MKKDPKVFLAHIVESIDLVEEYSHNKTLQDFMALCSRPRLNQSMRVLSQQNTAGLHGVKAAAGYDHPQD